MNLKQNIIIFLLAGMFAATGLCGNAMAKKSARIGYVQWASATAATHVIKAVLQKKLDYEVTLTSVSATAIWQDTASGDLDGFVCAWLPSLHAHYYEKFQNDVVNLGPNLEGTKIGLVVPAYVTIDSIAALDAHADKFNGQITGIDHGARIMSTTEEALAAYDIEGLELEEGSGAMMTMVLQDKIKNKEWVVVTGWTPHWKFHRFDLKYLEDPKKIYGGTEYLKTIVRKNLESQKPDLFAFLDNFQWETDDLHAVMDYIRQSGNPYKSAVQWMRENPQKIEAWLPE